MLSIRSRKSLLGSIMYPPSPFFSIAAVLFFSAYRDFSRLDVISLTVIMSTRCRQLHFETISMLNASIAFIYSKLDKHSKCLGDCRCVRPRFCYSNRENKHFYNMPFIFHSFLIPSSIQSPFNPITQSQPSTCISSSSSPSFRRSRHTNHSAKQRLRSSRHPHRPSLNRVTRRRSHRRSRCSHPVELHADRIAHRSRLSCCSVPLCSECCV